MCSYKGSQYRCKCNFSDFKAHAPWSTLYCFGTKVSGRGVHQAEKWSYCHQLFPSVSLPLYSRSYTVSWHFSLPSQSLDYDTLILFLSFTPSKHVVSSITLQLILRPKWTIMVLRIGGAYCLTSHMHLLVPQILYVSGSPKLTQPTLEALDFVPNWY